MSVDGAGSPLLLAELERLRGEMTAGGFAKRIGFGARPAVVVVDLIRGFTDPASPMGHAGFRPAVVGSRALVDAARAVDVPVVLVGSAFDARFLEAGTWERKVTHEAIVHGSVWAEFDPDLAQAETDLVVIKRYPSSFFGTELASTLVSLGVDTVLIGGASTSGCVRATALDAVQHGFRPIVVEQAVADRFALPHLANLFDIDMKIGDVVDLEQAVGYLRSGSPASQAAPSA